MVAEFDLGSFLWGDRVATATTQTTSASDPPRPVVAESPTPTSAELGLETFAPPEPSQPRHTDWSQATDARTEESDDLDDEYEIEEILGDEQLDSDLEDELEGAGHQESVLSYMELGQRLRWVVLPRLQMTIERNGRLTLGSLAYSVQALENSEPHLREVYDFVRRSGVPVLASRVNRRGTTSSMETLEIAKRRFGHLLRGRPDDAWVLRRLGYEHIQLSRTERELLLDAWEHHILARVEEAHYCAVVAAEVERVDDDIRRWSHEALAAREALVLDNLWVVARVIRPYLGQGLDLEDLYQEGAKGLFRAVVKYDPSKTHRFMGYATSWIWQRVTRALADDSRLIRLPVHVWEEVRPLDAARDAIYERTGYEPTPLQLARQLGWSPARVEYLLQIEQPVVSLDGTTQIAEAVAEMLAAESDDIPNALDATAFGEALATVLPMLTPREREVLELRFGLAGKPIHTLEEVGECLAVTRERIRQIEAKAIEKLQGGRFRPLLSGLIEGPAKDDHLKLPVLSPAVVSKVLHSFSAEKERLAVAAMFMQSERTPGELGRMLTALNLTPGDAQALADRVKALTDEWTRNNALSAPNEGRQTAPVESVAS